MIISKIFTCQPETQKVSTSFDIVFDFVFQFFKFLSLWSFTYLVKFIYKNFAFSVYVCVHLCTCVCMYQHAYEHIMVQYCPLS